MTEEKYFYLARHFRNCLLVEQLQEVARATKWALDEFVANEEQKKERLAVANHQHTVAYGADNKATTKSSISPGPDPHVAGPKADPRCGAP